MGRFIKVDLLGSPAIMEVDEPKDGEFELLGLGGNLPKFEFGNAVDTIKKCGEFLVEHMKTLSPSEVELTCGFKAGVEGGNMVWGFAKANSEASFSVKLKWSSDEK